MRLLSILLLAGALQLSASVKAQNKLNMHYKAISVGEALKEVKRQSQFDLFYSLEEIDHSRKVSVNLENAELLDALKQILGNKYNFRVVSKMVVISPKEETSPQVQPGFKIEGAVRDSKGNPLPGVTVVVKGTSVGVSTDIKGEFKINVPKSKDVYLVFSFIGLKTKEIKITNQKLLNVVLQEAVSEIDEVVVTGYQEVKKERMTGSVSTVDAKTIAESGVTSMDQVLKGALAGVSVMNISGRPGETSQIRIRGLNSITGNMEPIWIVDGMELQGGVPNVNVGGTDFQNSIFTNGIGNISPEDIKSITILKDAAASAIYGARAANGVIVVETKKGTAGESYINFSSSFSISEAPKNKLQMMNTAQKMAFEKSIYDDFGGSYDINGRVYQVYKKMGAGEMSRAEGEAILNELSRTETDWFDELYRTGVTQKHNLSISGGDEKTQYYISASLLNEDGILEHNTNSNFNGYINISHRPNNKLKLEGSIRSGIRKDHYPIAFENPFRYATFANPYEKPYNDDGSYAYDESSWGDINPLTNELTYAYNILEDMETSRKKSRAVSTTFMGKMTWDILPFLSLETQLTYTNSSDNTEEWAEPGSVGSKRRNWILNSGGSEYVAEFNNGYLKETNGYNNQYALKNILKYNYSTDKHFFNALLGQEISERKIRNFFNLMPEYYPEYKIAGYPDDIPVDLEDIAFDRLGGTGRDVSKTSSFFANASYSYCDKYVISGSVRYDGVDIVGNSNQFSPLWNASAKWNVHKEEFLKAYPFINILSVRYSHGYTGSIDHNALPYSYMTYTSRLEYLDNLIPNQVNWRNPSIKWQKKLDRNLGLDFSVLENKISGEFNYYNNKITDLLDYKTLAISSGRKSIKANVSTITNSGCEFRINTVNINTKDFRWTTTFNIAVNDSEILESYNKNITDLPIFLKHQANSNHFIEGKGVSSWYGYQFAGVDPITGNTLAYIVDESKVEEWQVHSEKNGRKVIDMDENFIHEACISYLGKSHPPTTGGFGTTLKYKQFSLNAQFTFMTGHKIMSPINTTSGFETNVERNSLVDNLNRWREPGQITNIPEFRTISTDYAYNKYFYDSYLEKGDFLKCSYINLNYYLPQSFVQKMGLQRVKLSFNANNVFTWTKYRGIDPENNGAFNYPSARKYTLNVNLNF